jgi:Putative peptidoglycan binding domain
MRTVPRGRKAAVIAVLALAVVAVAVIVATGSGSGSSGGGGPATLATHTAKIERKDLVEVDTEDGTLGYQGTRNVVNHKSGTVTWLPAVGRVIAPGHTLYRVDGDPVLLLSGSAPAFRDLKAGVSDGADVEQLERNLRVLGYDPDHAITIDRTWSSGTTAAVERFQTAHDMTSDGTLALGTVVFQPGARRVASLSASLGGSASGGAASGSGSGSTSGVSATPTSGRIVFASYVVPVATATTPSTATTAPAPTTTTTTPAPTTTVPSTTTPQATTPVVPATAAPTGGSRGSGGASAAAAGGGGATSSASGSGASVSNTIMTTTSTRRVVTVSLDTTKSSLARTGSRVTVTLPSGNTVHGRITDVGKVATKPSSTSGNNDSAAATITVTIALFSTGTTLDQAPVSVDFEQSRRKNVLAIPVTALIAQTGGRFAVEVVDGDQHRVVTVTPGLYTRGEVEITGQGLQPGMRVANAAV